MPPPPPLLRLGSSLRTRSAAATLDRALPLMPALGISRVTDITRVDRLGLPVFASVRPRGRALCVHAGKGLRADEARVGALMEAVEYAAAEPDRSEWRRRSLRIGELKAEWAGRVRMLDLAPRTGPGAPDDRLVDVVACEDVAGGPALPLPAELIFVPCDDPHGASVFGWTSNGLASGNTPAEATLHGLLEVLERDALAMDMPHDASCWLEPDDLPPPFAELAARWRATGVALSVRFVPNEFGLPCLRALLHEGGGAPVDLAGGHGLHLDPGIALARAVCEAAQSRLSHIHGGRDDITRFYAKWRDGAVAPDSADVRETLAYRAGFDTTRRIAWRDVPALPLAGTSVDEVLAALVERLRGQGFPRVLRHVFALDLGGLSVVKVVVPRCQEIDETCSRLGARLYARLLAHA